MHGLSFYTLDDFFCEGEYGIKAFLLNLAGDRAEDTSCAGLLLFVHEHHRIVVEADVRAVAAYERFCRADDEALYNLLLLHCLARLGALHGSDNDFA